MAVDESALTIIEPALATDEPAFDALFEAVTQRTPISFAHQSSRAPEPLTRHVEPWGIVSWHGHWYVVGHDRDRDAERMFRVSRIVGDVVTIGEPGSYHPPVDLDLRALAESLAPPHPNSSATIRVRVGYGDQLRRRAVRSRPVDEQWTELELRYASGQSLADELLSYGPDVVVIGPEEVRSDVIDRLTVLASEGGS